MSEIIDKTLFALKNCHKLFSYEEVKGDMFEYDNCFLLHAVNAKGVMGAGVAGLMSKKYPEMYKEYARICSIFGRELEGLPIILSSDDNNLDIINLVTSVGYGKDVASEKEILLNTKTSLLFALRSLYEDKKFPIQIVSNRFNSGLFNVPWEKTLEVIYKTITLFMTDIFFKDEVFFKDCLENDKKILKWTTCYV